MSDKPLHEFTIEEIRDLWSSSQAGSFRMNAAMTHIFVLLDQVVEWRERAERLWQLLDDIDTFGDVAKSDDKLFRKLVEARHKRCCDLAQSPDGFGLDWVSPLPPKAPDILPDPDGCAPEDGPRLVAERVLGDTEKDKS